MSDDAERDPRLNRIGGPGSPGPHYPPTPKLVLCGEPSPIGNTNACPREKDHEGEHYCWGEGRAHGNTYGITVMRFDGEKVCHLTMEGRSEPETVCALLALVEIVTDRNPGRHLPEEEQQRYRDSQQSIIDARRHAEGHEGQEYIG